MWRSPGGIAVEAAEGERSAGGYFAQVVGAHDADIAALVEEVQVAIRQRIGRLDLERSPHGGHWIMAGDDLTGRLVWQDDDEPYGVVVDGRPLRWEEFGRALEPFQGWEFRLVFDVRYDDGEESEEPLEATEPSAFGPAPNTRTH